ncbi:MAG: hypothetical protein IKK33_15245 [Lachnospiraceae bacterium]|nr:hypothetical protein [Lachnospiraceae bacterium]
MMCPECGTANNIRDVIERIEDEPRKVDSDMQAIKGFDMDEHPVSHNAEWKSAESRRLDSIIKIGFLLTALILYLLHKSGLVDVLALMEKLDGLFELRR